VYQFSKAVSTKLAAFIFTQNQRRESLMKEFWNTIQLIFAAVGGWLGYFLGGCDGLLIALIIFVVCDYITGVLCAIADKKLSSAVGFKGICRKVLIFILVGIANILDIHVLGHEGVLRTAIIFFYISNEGLSLTENAAHLGLPIPGKLKDVLEQLHDRNDKEEQ
jgi:toxin secretion/phage lysis holin